MNKYISKLIYTIKKILGIYTAEQLIGCFYCDNMEERIKQEKINNKNHSCGATEDIYPEGILTKIVTSEAKCCPYCISCEDIAAVVTFCSFHAEQFRITNIAVCPECPPENKEKYITRSIVNKGQISYYCKDHGPLNDKDKFSIAYSEGVETPFSVKKCFHCYQSKSRSRYKRFDKTSFCCVADQFRAANNTRTIISEIRCCWFCTSNEHIAAVVPFCLNHAIESKITTLARCQICLVRGKEIYITCAIVNEGKTTYYCEEHDPFNESKL